MKQPDGYRIPLSKLLAGAVAGALCVVIWALFMTPSVHGESLKVAMRAMAGISKIGGNAPPYANVVIEPIRHTPGSVIASDLAMRLTADQKDMHTAEGVLANSHGPQVMMAFQKGFSGIHHACTVRASAQAFDHERTVFASVLNVMGSREDAFLLLLAHEMAHCYWNPGPLFEQKMNAKAEQDPGVVQVMIGLMPLLINIMESYADAYPVILTARVDQNLHARAKDTLVTFRAQNGVSKNFYNTLDAIEAASQFAKVLPASTSALRSNWEVTHKYVLSAALTGAMHWQIKQGVTQDEAIRRIRFILEGQNVDFGLRKVNEKDYLIVTKAPMPGPDSAMASTPIGTLP